MKQKTPQTKMFQKKQDSSTLFKKKIQFNYEYITSKYDVPRILDWISGQKSYLVDSETTGRNVFVDKPILLQIGNSAKQWIVDLRAVDPRLLKEALEDSSKPIIGLNLKFDWKVLKHHFDIEMTNMIDVMIIEQLLRCGLGLRVSMEALADHYLGIQIDKDPSLRSSFKNTPVNGFSVRQLEYAAGDVIYPEFILPMQKPLILERGLKNTVLMEMAVLPIIGAMDLRGLRIDRIKWLKLYQEAIEGKAQAERKLDQFFGVSPVEALSLFGDHSIIHPINYSSWQQVLSALKKKGYVLESTDKDVVALAAINEQIPLDFARALAEYRIYNKRTSTYGLNVLRLLDEEDVIHTDFSQAFVVTGRLSSGTIKDDEADSDDKGFNFQNIPHLPSYRACFIPREGYVFVIYDLKAIEPRVMADLTHDPLYVETFINEKDIYNNVGENIFHEPVNKSPGRPSELRAKTKIAVLGTSYGTGKNKFHIRMQLDLNVDDEGFIRENIIKVSREESDQLWEGIVESCSHLKETMDEWSKAVDPLNSERKVYDDRTALEPAKKVFAKIMDTLHDRFEYELKDGKIDEDEIKLKAVELMKSRGHVTYSETVGGRKRYYRVYHRNWWTDGRNHPIQGTAGGDIMKTAMIDVHSQIKLHKHDAHIVNQIHDELIIEVRKDQAEEASVYIKNAIEGAGNKFMKTIKCRADGGIYDAWIKE